MEPLRRRRRSLPWDVLLVLFELADPASLALLGRVSYDFLVATVPHLYRDVLLKSSSQIEKMFCERENKKSSSSRINSLLTLDNIHSLTLDFSSTPTPSSFVVPELSFNRLSSSIPLDSLVISLPEREPAQHLGPVHLSLLHALNPRHCEYTMDRDLAGGRPLRSGFLAHKEEGYTLWEWTRIEVVDLVGCIPYVPYTWQTGDYYEVAFLPYSIFPQLQFRYHVLSLLDEESPSPERLVGNLEYTSWAFGYDLTQDGSMVLVVHSEEEKDEVEAAVAQTTLGAD